MTRADGGRLAVKLLIIAAVVLACLAGATALAARFTESDKFCGTDCHEMWPYRDTWATSTHKQVACVRCHVPPGAVDFVVTKLYATREVWVHVTGQVKVPIKITRHIPVSACMRSGCHGDGGLAKTLSLGRPAPVRFRHGGDGHARQSCIACHATLAHDGAPGVAAPPANSMASCFTCHTDGPKDCTACHAAPHEDRGKCQDCHTLRSWGAKDFRHPQPLVGEHAELLCEKCHVDGVGSKPTGCVDCHGDRHNGLADCVRCHRITAWTPTSFVHPREGPHVPAGEEPLPCDACHQGGFGQKPGCPCHGGSAPAGD